MIRNCFGFASLRSAIGPENAAPSTNQIKKKLQRIMIWSLTFSRALGRLVGFTPSSNRLLNFFPLLLIPRCDNDTHSVINEVSG